MKNPVDELDNHDRLLYEIGKTAQLHVQLERSVRNIHVALCTPSDAIYLASTVQGMERLVEDCKIMLKKADVPQEVKDHGLKVLASAKAADKSRHRLVHDWWMEKIDEKTHRTELHQLQLKRGALGYEVSVSDIERVKQVPETLVHSFYQTNALVWALYQTLPFYRGAGFDNALLADSLEIMSGNFEVQGDGGVKVIK